MRDVRQVCNDVAVPCDPDEKPTACLATRVDSDSQQLPVVGEAGQVVNAHPVLRDSVRVRRDAMTGLGEKARGVALRLVSPEHSASRGKRCEGDQAHDAPQDDEGDTPTPRAPFCWVYRHFASPLG